MNYLELCQRARQEAGISGSGPTTVTGQIGQLAKIVDWVATAWTDVQRMRPNWLFMNSEFTFDTAAATRDYLASDYSITDLLLWDYDSFLIYETAVGESDENFLTYYTYANWRSAFRARMNDRANERPQLFTILPSNEIRFEPRPDKIYTITGEYKRTAQTLTDDADTPTGLPEDFHMVIVWAALKYYGFHENAPEVLDQAETNFDALLLRLENEQLPEMSQDYKALA